MTYPPSPGVMNAFQLYEARKAGLVTGRVSPEHRTLIPPISEATRKKIIRLLKKGVRNKDVEKQVEVGHSTITRIKRQLRDKGELK